jgi:hypothetical protein
LTGHNPSLALVFRLTPRLRTRSRHRRCRPPPLPSAPSAARTAVRRAAAASHRAPSHLRHARAFPCADAFPRPRPRPRSSHRRHLPPARAHRLSLAPVRHLAVAATTAPPTLQSAAASAAPRHRQHVLQLHRVFCRTRAAALHRFHAALSFASPNSQRRVLCDRDGS